MNLIKLDKLALWLKRLGITVLNGYQDLFYGVESIVFFIFFKDCEKTKKKAFNRGYTPQRYRYLYIEVMLIILTFFVSSNRVPNGSLVLFYHGRSINLFKLFICTYKIC